jgi:murein DD-endopeptidase MepM/ murein hydrolase activator NlpD
MHCPQAVGRDLLRGRLARCVLRPLCTAITLSLACNTGAPSTTTRRSTPAGAQARQKPVPPEHTIIYPVGGAKIVSRFGIREDPFTGESRQHKGVDFRVPIGTSVRVTDAGTVVKAGWQSVSDRRKGFGIRVIVDHGGGNISIYGHLNSLTVKVGDVVGKSDVIGTSGETGNSVGPHLHYEERFEGTAHPPTFHPATYALAGTRVEQRNGALQHSRHLARANSVGGIGNPPVTANP